MLKVLELSSLGALVMFSTTSSAATNQVFSGSSKVDGASDGLATAPDVYTMYTGDGSECSGWPGMDDWISFEAMWQANIPLMSVSCGNLYGSGVPDSSTAELASLQTAIKAKALKANVDPRFVLAVVMQESKGCIRVETTGSPDGTVRNPGLMQDHNGDYTCNVINDPIGAQKMTANGTNLQATGGASLAILNPCPDSVINGMIADGTSGTAAGDGLAGVLNLALTYPAIACSTAAATAAVSSHALLGVRQDFPSYNNGLWTPDSSLGAPFKSDSGSYGWVPGAQSSHTWGPGPDGQSYGTWGHGTGGQPYGTWGQTTTSSSKTSTTTTTTHYVTVTVTGPAADDASSSSSQSQSLRSVSIESVVSASLASSASSSMTSAPSASSTQTPAPGPSATGVVNARTYYRAARLYNSGSLDVTDLGNGYSSTHCYASDIANRLSGWTGLGSPSNCT